MFHHNSNEWLDSMLESPQKNRRKKHLAGLIKECKAVKDGAKELRERLFPPKPSKSRNELGILYRIRWYFQKASVAGLNLMLESAKTSIMLFITLQMCEGLRKRIDELEQELNKPPGEIKTLKHQLRHTRRQLRDQIEYVQRIHERLEQHTMNSLVSGSVIGTSAQTVVSEMHAMEQYFVNTLQAETMNSELEALQEEMVEQEATYYTTSTGGF
ncbi:unnamed protein product [Periconia digitata]|uniref:Uncharacterized protein n=1 Tax=Periconia digitata TaxID=1303443 RepID=A0A9W4UBD7_9PLEO|nr:unnamed protein product [Periconia digitata]